MHASVDDLNLAIGASVVAMNQLITKVQQLNEDMKARERAFAVFAVIGITDVRAARGGDCSTDQGHLTLAGAVGGRCGASALSKGACDKSQSLKRLSCARAVAWRITGARVSGSPAASARARLLPGRRHESTPGHACRHRRTQPHACGYTSMTAYAGSSTAMLCCCGCDASSTAPTIHAGYIVSEDASHQRPPLRAVSPARRAASALPRTSARPPSTAVPPAGHRWSLQAR